MKKLFGGLNLTWPKRIIWAVLAAVYTAAMAILPITKDGSFRDIAVTFEVWVFFGTIIIMNSKSARDSALKCFVFFLVSQPLIYLIRVPFSWQGWNLFQYYKYWFIWTLLTIPMGYLGYYLKKGTMKGLLLIMTPVLIFLSFFLFGYLGQAIAIFPHHLLTALFIIACMYLFVLGIFEDKKVRRVGLIIVTVLVLAAFSYNMIPSVQESRYYKTSIMISGNTYDFDDSYEVALEDPSFGTLSIEKLPFKDNGEDVFAVNAVFKKTGKTRFTLKGEGKVYVYDLEVWTNTYNLTLISDD